MKVKVLSLLNGFIALFALAACAGSAQTGTPQESQGRGSGGAAWVFILFLALAFFFWWWLRQSDGQATPSIYSNKPRKDESNPAHSSTPAQSVERTPVKIHPATESKATLAKSDQVVEKSAEVAIIAEPTQVVDSVPTVVADKPADQPAAPAIIVPVAATVAVEAVPAVAATAPIATDVIMEDPVHSKQMVDKQKKALKKSAAGEDDFTIVEGIGPKINGVLHEAGIKTYAELGASAIDALRQILASNNLQYHDPGTWPEQSALADAKKWDELGRLQSTLSGGKRK